MRVEYKRETNRNYMVIFPDQPRNSRYSEKMLSENHISGLLCFHAKQIDQICSYYYDITSKQPLNRIMEMRMLKGREICQMFSDMLYTLQRMENFLLDEGQLSLRPEYIYIDPETFHSQLCLIPGKTGDFSAEFRNLSKDILDHVDYSDPEAVMLAFGIFKESQKPNFGLEKIEKIVRKKENERTAGEEEFMEEPENGEREEIELEIPADPVCRPDLKKEPEEAEEKLLPPVKDTMIIRIFLIFCMVIIPVGIVLISGPKALAEYKYVLIAAESVLLFLIMAADHGRKEKEPEKQSEEQEKTEIKTEGRREKETSRLPEGMIIPFENEKEVPLTSDQEEEFQTILLTTPGSEKPSAYLIPSGKGPEIPIPYTPFIIGKSRELADFCLDRPSVSRMHMRIDLEEGNYYVTDLNSTNGTKIGEDRLSVNEKRKISDGEEIRIAEYEYHFFTGENQFR